MKRFDLWKLSLLNVFSAPVRSMLTVLGFAIGVAAILAVLTLGDAGKTQVQSEMGRLGIDKVWVTAAAGKGMPQGTGQWLEQTAGANADELVYVPMEIKNSAGKTSEAIAVGCSWAYVQRMQMEEMQCRAINWNVARQIALIGEKLAGELDVQPGEIIQAGKSVFRICGVVSSTDSLSSVPLEETLILPIDAVCAWTGGSIGEIQLTAPDGLSVQKTHSLVRQALLSQGIDAEIATMQVQMEAANSVIATFVNVLKWVSVVCILVGGIGVMNILLVSVRERRREIGVMKSLGTTSVQICTLFLLEALIYAVIGGLLGIALGMILVRAAGASIELSACVRVSDCISVFACAVGIGLVFGVLPAFRASRLSCVDALRQE